MHVQIQLMTAQGRYVIWHTYMGGDPAGTGGRTPPPWNLSGIDFFRICHQPFLTSAFRPPPLPSQEIAAHAYIHYGHGKCSSTLMTETYYNILIPQRKIFTFTTTTSIRNISLKLWGDKQKINKKINRINSKCKTKHLQASGYVR